MKRFDTAKLAMSVFIASEAVFFAFLIAAYVYYYGAVVHGPERRQQPQPAPDPDLYQLPARQQRHAVGRGAPPGQR